MTSTTEATSRRGRRRRSVGNRRRRRATTRRAAGGFLDARWLGALTHANIRSRVGNERAETRWVPVGRLRAPAAAPADDDAATEYADGHLRRLHAELERKRRRAAHWHHPGGHPQQSLGLVAGVLRQRLPPPPPPPPSPNGAPRAGRRVVRRRPPSRKTSTRHRRAAPHLAPTTPQALAETLSRRTHLARPPKSWAGWRLLPRPSLPRHRTRAATSPRPSAPRHPRARRGAAPRRALVSAAAAMRLPGTAPAAVPEEEEMHDEYAGEGYGGRTMGANFRRAQKKRRPTIPPRRASRALVRRRRPGPTPRSRAAPSRWVTPLTRPRSTERTATRATTSSARDTRG